MIVTTASPVLTVNSTRYRPKSLNSRSAMGFARKVLRWRVSPSGSSTKRVVAAMAWRMTILAGHQLLEGSICPSPGFFEDCRFSQARVVNHLAPTGEAGAKRRVRILSAWRHFLAPGIKILMLSAKKAPCAKVPHPSLSRPGEGVQACGRRTLHYRVRKSTVSVVVVRVLFSPLPHFVVGEGR